MVLWTLLLLATPGDLPVVEVDTLTGKRHSGGLSAITATALELEGQSDSVPLSQILEVRFPETEAPAATDENQLEVNLADGTRLSATAVTAARQEVSCTTSTLGTVAVAASQVASIRFGPPEPKLLETWNKLLDKSEQKDLLVIRKGDILDFLSGVIGDINDQTVSFLLDQDVIPVKRERVYGIIFQRRSKLEKPQCRVELAGGDSLQVRDLRFDGSTWQATLANGPRVSLPTARLARLDFSLGKIRYLSQMEPVSAIYVPYFDESWPYRRDRSLDGGPIRIGGQTFQRGLAIHSQTTLRYRLGGEYRRFQATMGIDDSVARVANGANVVVVISADGRQLLSRSVTGTDNPVAIDEDVSGVRELEIQVQFGANESIGDHLDLGDARVLK